MAHVHNLTNPATGSGTSLSDSLNQVLAGSHALMSLTHLALRNAEGPGFFALRAAFQTQHGELFTAIDAVTDDPESQDLMIGRITQHQRATWMPKNFLKG